MPKFVILTGKHQGQRMSLPQRELIAGRDEGCELRLTGTEVSRRHTKLRIDGESVYVSDLGSRNGTLVNDVLIAKETLLQPGDIVRIGAMAFQLDAPKPKAAPKPIAVPPPSANGLVDVKLATEDSIANWLTDDEPLSGTGDSTIVSKSSSSDTAVRPVFQTPSAPKEPKKHFATVKDEAEDIIRRHRESLKAR